MRPDRVTCYKTMATIANHMTQPTRPLVANGVGSFIMDRGSLPIIVGCALCGQGYCTPVLAWAQVMLEG